MAPWGRIDDTYTTHPKTLRVTLEASGLEARAWSWAAGALTDGHIPAGALPVIAGGDRRARKIAAELVKVGRWHTPGHACRCPQPPDGWQIHDWADYAPTAEQVQRKRQADRERQARHRGGAVHDDDTGRFVSRRDNRSDNGRDAQKESRRDIAASHAVPDPEPEPRVLTSPTDVQVSRPRAAGDGDEPERPYPPRPMTADQLADWVAGKLWPDKPANRRTIHAAFTAALQVADARHLETWAGWRLLAGDQPIRSPKLAADLIAGEAARVRREAGGVPVPYRDDDDQEEEG